MQLSAENVKNEDDFTSGRSGKIEPQLCQACINHMAFETSKNQNTPGISVEFQIIADGITGYKIKKDKEGRVIGISGGTKVENQCGMTRKEFYVAEGKTQETTDKAMMNLTRLAMAVGLLQPGQTADVEWSDGIGRELFIEFTPERKEVEENGKKEWKETGYVKVDWFAFWSLGNKAMAGVPSDPTTPGMQQLARAGGVSQSIAGSNGNGNGHKAATTTPNAPTAAQSADAVKRSKFANL